MDFQHHFWKVDFWWPNPRFECNNFKKTYFLTQKMKKKSAFLPFYCIENRFLALYERGYFKGWTGSRFFRRTTATIWSICILNLRAARRLRDWNFQSWLLSEQAIFGSHKSFSVVIKANFGRYRPAGEAVWNFDTGAHLWFKSRKKCNFDALWTSLESINLKIFVWWSLHVLRDLYYPNIAFFWNK